MLRQNVKAHARAWACAFIDRARRAGAGVCRASAGGCRARQVVGGLTPLQEGLRDGRDLDVDLEQ